MSERVWHKGPPPHIGWWETSASLAGQSGTSTARLTGAWRWWDGSCWSLYCMPDEHPGGVARRAKLPSGASGRMEWTDYWPENARVPRLDPTGGHWTFNNGAEPKHKGPIDIAFRSGSTMPEIKAQHGWRWSIEGWPFDILAWRPAA